MLIEKTLVENLAYNKFFIVSSLSSDVTNHSLKLRGYDSLEEALDAMIELVISLEELSLTSEKFKYNDEGRYYISNERLLSIMSSDALKNIFA